MRGIFSSLQGWFCVGVLCALQCAKNSVGSGRQSHGSLYMCRMLNRVTHNNVINALDEALINEVKKYAIIEPDSDEIDFLKAKLRKQLN